MPPLTKAALRPLLVEAALRPPSAEAAPRPPLTKATSRRGRLKPRPPPVGGNTSPGLPPLLSESGPSSIYPSSVSHSLSCEKAAHNQEQNIEEMASPSRVEHPDGVTAETLRSAGLSAPQNRSPLRDVDENEEQPRQRERDQPLIPPPLVGQYQERDPYYEQPNDRAEFYEREDQFEPRRRNAPRENFFDQRGRENQGWQNQRQGGNQGGNSSYNTYRGNSNAPIPPQRDGPYRPPPTQRVGGYPPRDEPPRESFEEKMLRMMTEIKQDMGHMRQEWKQDIRQEVSAVRQEVSNYRQESTSSIRNLENQMAQVTKTMAERPRGALPSTTENNPRERVQAITLRSGKELPDPVLHKGSISKSPIEEENVKISVEENAEQNTGTVAPAGSHAEKALEKGKEKADVPVYRPPLPYPGRSEHEYSLSLTNSRSSESGGLIMDILEASSNSGRRRGDLKSNP
nr:uncharacterized protein LOC109154451 [Ipomoea trifida]